MDLKPSAALVGEFHTAMAGVASLSKVDPGTGAAISDYIYPIFGDFADSDSLTVDGLPTDWKTNGDSSDSFGPLEVAYGDQQPTIDPLSDKRQIEILPKAGQWRWGGPDVGSFAFPLTLYGYVVTNHAGTAIVARVKFPEADRITFEDALDHHTEGSFAIPIDPNAFDS